MSEGSTRISSFWLNIGFLDREMEMSQRLQVLTALENCGIETRCNLNILRAGIVPRGLGKVWLLKLPVNGLAGTALLVLKQLLVLLANSDADLVVVRAFNLHFVLPFWLLWRKLLHRPRPKFILDIRTLPVDVQGNWRGRLRELRFKSSLRIATRNFDGIMMITEAMRTAVFGENTNEVPPTCIWTSGVNPTIFDPSATVALKGSLGLENRFVLIYHGIFSPNRGLQQAVDAVDIVRRSAPDIKLFFLGKGSAEKEILSRIRSLGLEDHVLVHPPVSHFDVPAYINAADLGILPFPNLDWWNTSSPIKLFEYLAMEKPVVVTDIPAHRSVLGKCNFGFFARDNSPESLANAILVAIKNKDKLRQYGRDARELAVRHYSWEGQALKIRNFFKHLLEVDSSKNAFPCSLNK